jgi:hypothetical protein
MDAGDGLNAFVHKTPEIALTQARAADTRLAAGEAPAICGIPLGIKDLFCTKGVASQAGSNILRGFRPEYESTVTQKLFDSGAVMLGKLNMDEFAMGSSNETSCYGNAVNPWRRGNDETPLTPGGSSGGSAAAVAADLCLGALGTDTGGSIRQPAAFTGITSCMIVGLSTTVWGNRTTNWVLLVVLHVLLALVACGMPAASEGATLAAQTEVHCFVASRDQVGVAVLGKQVNSPALSEFGPRHWFGKRDSR